MRSNRVILFAALAACVLSVMVEGSVGAQSTSVLGLEKGTPDLKSAGPLAFGPYGVLLVGDTQSATVFAIDTRDKSGDPNSTTINVDDLGAKLSEVLDGAEVAVNDLAVNPLSGNVYVSVTASEKPALCRVDSDGTVSRLSLEKHSLLQCHAAESTWPTRSWVKAAGVATSAASRSRTWAFLDGQVIVTGLTAGDGPSNARTLAFPFVEADRGASLEIYHGAHGRQEDNAVVRTFVALNIGGEPSLLAGFTCTPLVRFPLGSLVDGDTVRGTTVAELGNRKPPVGHDRVSARRPGLPVDGQQCPRCDEDQHCRHRTRQRHHRACGWRRHCRADL